jgi:hypothetical protein
MAVVQRHGLGRRRGAEAGELLSDLLRRTFARLRMAAELGKEPAGVITDEGRKLLSGNDGLLDDVHGLMVYRTKPRPRFFSGGFANTTVGRHGDLSRHSWRQAETRIARPPWNRLRRCTHQSSRYRSCGSGTEHIRRALADSLLHRRLPAPAADQSAVGPAGCVPARFVDSGGMKCGTAAGPGAWGWGPKL